MRFLIKEELGENIDLNDFIVTGCKNLPGLKDKVSNMEQIDFAK